MCQFLGYINCMTLPPERLSPGSDRMKKNLLISLLLSLMVIACGPDRTGKVPTVSPDSAAEAEVKEKAAVEDVPVEEPAEGLVVYTSGDVFVRREGSEFFLDIGDTLVQTDVVGTAADSYCEIQLGEMAVVRMEENTLIEMSSLQAGRKGSRMSIDLDKGQVLFKVRKLLDEDAFKVQAGTVVCGVRGTEFAVSSRREGEILLAVKEGSVAVVPAALEKVRELAWQEPSLKGVAAGIENVSLVVMSSEELAIDQSAFEEVKTVLPLIEEVLKKIEQKKASLEGVDKRDGEALKAAEASIALIDEEVVKQAALLMDAIEKTPELVAPGKLKKNEISEESRETLKSTDNLELISFTAPDGRESGSKPVLPELIKISIRVEPADARILLGAKVLATGHFSGLYKKGKTLDFSFQLEGYKPQKLDLLVSDDSLREYILTLLPAEDLNMSLPVEAPLPEDLPDKVQPESPQQDKAPTEPIEVQKSLSSDDFVGRIGGSGDLMAGADKRGVVSAFNRSGMLLWQFQSENRDNANSSPVIHKGRVYFSGAAELVILNSTDGTLIARYPLAEDRSHIYGREIIPFGEDLLFPADNELIVMNIEGVEKAAYAIPESSGMTPSLWKDRIVIADNRGTLLVMDSSNGNILSAIATGSLQPVAQNPAVNGDIAVFSSRKGIVTAVNLANESVLWERKLGSTVFTSIIAENEGCYVYTTRQELFGLSWENGKNLFPPMSGISAAPGYEKGRLYMTDKKGRMHVVNAADGTVEKTLSLNDSFSARPIIRGGILIGVGKGGNFYRINTEAIPGN